ncbi:uncharacterized protein PG986_002855 [Apiospora aurea]|uniref:Protein kinase domain-containing protein n=1 Tax=Apiospora aurea TaxID=335848 RepID=A0ABR1QQ08_9PEZI
MATGGNMKVLAIQEAGALDGYIVRARVDGLIRYFSVTFEAASKFPAGWNKNGGSGPLIPVSAYPPDLKCIHLRRPDHRDNINPEDETDYPIAEPLMGHKLTGIGNPKGLPEFDYDSLIQLQKVPSPGFENRLTTDRLCRVQPKTSAPSGGGPLLMKLAEFPAIDTWPIPIPDDLVARAKARWKKMKAQLLSIESDRDPAHIERIIGHEIKMHHEVAAALSETGLVPKFHGVVTELGRGVAGFLSEFIAGSKSFDDLFKAAAARKDMKWAPSEAEGEAFRYALRRLHRAGFVHNDVHPGNFLLRSDGWAVIIDFEEAERLEPGAVLEGKKVHPRVSDDISCLEEFLNWNTSAYLRRLEG